MPRSLLADPSHTKRFSEARIRCGQDRAAFEENDTETHASAIDDNSAAHTHRALNAALWAAQVLLAAAFGIAGVMKTTTPIETLSPNMAWVAEVPFLLRFIGAAELAAALGLLLPSLTRILPRLTALAAAGLVTVMTLAAALHVHRGETSLIAVNVALGALAAFVAWGRHRVAPIPSR